MQFTFGTDPEFHLINTKTGLPISAIGILREKKYAEILGENKYYYDNMLAECTVTPGKTRESTIKHIRKAFKNFNQFLEEKRAKFGNFLFDFCPVVDFPKTELRHPDALEVACEPETCVYSLIDYDRDHPEFKKIKTSFSKSGLRSSGGHIHIGGKLVEKQLTAIYLARMMDLFLGVTSIYLSDYESEKKRKAFYGKAGRYRYTLHENKERTLEYRTLSNFWLVSPKTVGFMWNMCNFIVQFVAEDKHLNYWIFDEKNFKDPKFWNSGGNAAKLHTCTYDVVKLQEAINKHDKELAHPYWEMIKGLLPVELKDELTDLMNSPPKNHYTDWNYDDN